MAIDQSIIDLYDDFTHSRLERRDFLERLAALTGSAAAAMAILPLLGPNYAQAAMVPADDNRLESKTISVKGVNGDIKAYQVKPKGAGRLGAVIVIHENRGLNAHIQDVARRVALEGFVAVAPDMLSPLGGTPSDPDAARDLFPKLDLAQNTQNLVTLAQALEKNSETNGKVGAVGFCWGGAAVNQLAVNLPSLAAAVPYYGRVPTAEDVAKIRAPVMAHYGELDKNINAGIAGFEEALKKNNKKYSIFIYDGANHAFNNETGADRYHKPSADLAWTRTVGFLKENLKG